MFHTIIYEPLTNALVFLTSFLWGNIGLAVIALTIIVKLILLPLARSTIKNQIAVKKLQPHLEEIKKQYSDKNEQAKKTMELYKEHKTNPLAGCLPVLIQLPIIIGLYRVFLAGSAIDTTGLYSFVHLPENISQMFLGINMTSKSIILALVAGATQYLQLRFSPTMQTVPTTAVNTADGKPDMQTAMMNNMQKTMKFTLPIMITFFSAVVPAAVALYWIITNIFTLAQEYFIYKQINKSDTIKTKTA
jgi:YidC/Oxa1 family membrane protein insertase